MKVQDFDQLSRDYKLLSSQLAQLTAGGTTDDPELLCALQDLAEATRNLKARLEDLERARAGQVPAPKKKPYLRLVK